MKISDKLVLSITLINSFKKKHYEFIEIQTILIDADSIINVF